MYDIFVIGNNPNWKTIKSKYPFAKKAKNFDEAKSKALTAMFWTVWDDIELKEDFDFSSYSIPKWDEEYVHIFKNNEYFDGLSLIPRHKYISDRELKYRFFTDKKEIDLVASCPKRYDIFYVDTYEEYCEALENSTTDLFWLVPSDVDVVDEFKFDLYFSHHNSYERQENHMFLNGDTYDGIILASKFKPISEREFKYRFLSDRKEWEILASRPKEFEKFNIKTYEDYLSACDQSTTDMFWGVWYDIEIVEDFTFDYYAPRYNQHITHIFKNGDHYDGLCLFSKHNKVSDKEFKYRFFNEKKEVDYVASYPKPYDKFNIDTYEEYLEAIDNSTTDMFWIVPSSLKILDNFKLDLYYTHHDTYNRTINHVFRNGDFYDGIMLTPREQEISKKEFNSWFVINRKEHDELASMPTAFDKFEITTYNDYLTAVEKSTTGMFWAIWTDVNVVEDFEFDYYVPRYNQHITHVFKNGEYLDGVCLFSKHYQISKKEFKYRFFNEKKEVDYIASYPKPYDKFIVDTYEQYLEAKTQTTTDMFYMIPSDVNVLEDFKFNVQCTRYENHALLNGDYYDGIFLVSKYIEISQKEITNKFIIDRKEEEILASSPVKFEVWYINSFEEYLTACEQSKTSMFWCVWPDVNVVEDFDFDYYVPRYNQHITHVFKNGEHWDGVCLFSKYNKVSEREFKYRFFTDKKEVDYTISYPKNYDIFYVNTYEEYVDAAQSATTDLFWLIPNDVVVVNDYKFDLYFSHHDTYSRQENHMFLNGDTYDGVILASKSTPISEREFIYRFLNERKEWDILVSRPQLFDKFYIKTYEQYLNACKESNSNMFWCVWHDVDVVEDFDFNYYVPKYNQHITHIFKNGDHFDGICLFSKHLPVSEREFKYRFFTEKKEIDYVASYPKQYDIFYIDSYDEYLNAVDESLTDLFYIVPSDVITVDEFKFDLYFSYHNSYDREENHMFLNGDTYDGIILASKFKSISEREFKHRFLPDKKEWEILASRPKEFNRFVNIKTYDDYLNAVKQSTTDMFWCVWYDIDLVEDFDFDYYVPRYNQHITHVFKNDEHWDGICLMSKHELVTEREFNYRFFSEKKEIELVASTPKPYDIFYINKYSEYLNAVETSNTDLFWIVPNDVEIVNGFNFDLYFSYHNSYDREENHVFKNGDTYDGVILASKKKLISEKEFNFRYLTDRKEWMELASRPKMFDKFNISTYKDYVQACDLSESNMFWGIWTDVDVVEDFDFDYYVPRYNQHITHIFKNGEHWDGICLFSKDVLVSEKEFKYRFFSEKKEIELVASYPKKYDTFTVTTYRDYLTALEKSTTDLFWMVPSEVEPLDTFAFDTYFSHHNTYDRNMNHSFKHLFRGEENYNGINLMSKHVPITEKEITFRYIVEKKEWDITASKVKPYDIVFISYNESNADENFDRVKTLYPRVKRVHGVKGIHQAHIKAAEQAGTDNFWVVDGDAVVVDDFKFDYEIPVWEHDTVHVWRSQNPVNNLVYGYGGVKLLPRQLTLDMDVTRPDMTTSISDKFKPVQVVSNITSFNTDEFSTWKSAFRECAKLAGKTIDRQVDAETEERLNVWCTEGADKPYGKFAIKGALAGRKFATEHPENLFKINDFDWLYEQFLNEKNSSK